MEMKIMWLCNIAPGAVRAMTDEMDAGALWLDHVFADLRKLQDVSIRVLYAGKTATEGKLGENCTYRGFTEKEAHLYTAELEDVFAGELTAFCPDVIHIWGTEYGHTLAMVNAAEKTGYLDKAVISIQGLCSVYTRHYAEGVPIKYQLGNTFRDFIKRNSLRDQIRKFDRRGQMEVAALKKAKHVIGRTDWDRACTTQLNPDVTYHFCNETLRQAFYQGAWSYANCKKHRIFTSSCEYPVKGFHYLLEALALIVKQYPDAEVVVSGRDPFPRKDLFGKLRTSVHASHLLSLIRKHGLEGKIRVAGFLSAEQMRQEFLQANVFAMPSTIENSPNSMGEAMVLGVPCVISNVGGVADLLAHKKEGFVYQSTAPYMLAHYIMEVFAMEDKAEEMGAAARAHATKTHNPQDNLQCLLNIYQKIAEGE